MIRAAAVTFATTLFLASTALAQAPGGEEDPVQKLKEIQKLMAEIEKDLAKASLDTGVQADERWVEEQIEKLLRSGKSEAETAQAIEKLFEKSGKQAEASRAEIEKLVKSIQEQVTKQADAAKKMEELEKAQAEAAERLRQLFEGLEKASSTAEKIEKMFEQSEGKQKEVIEQIQHLIETAKKMQMKGQGQEPKPEEPQEEEEGKEPKPQEKPKNPQEEEKPDGESPPDRNEADPRKEKEEEKNPPPDKGGRWGELQSKIMEEGRTGSSSGLLPGYGELANEYFKRITGGDRDRDEGKGEDR